MSRRDEDDEPVVLEDVECVHASDHAIKVLLSTGQTLWVPQSVVHDDSEVYGLGHKGKLVVAAWWARKQGLEA